MTRIRLALLWLGFILAISFMESWVKFKAPGVEYTQALSIGKTVFGALNKVEWFFFGAISISHFKLNFKANKSSVEVFGIIGALFLIQTLYLLPELNFIAEMKIKGPYQSTGLHHYFYVAIEVAKVILLIVYQKVVWKSINKSH